MLSRSTETSRATRFVLDQLLVAGAFVAAAALAPAHPSVAESAQFYMLCMPVVALALCAAGLYRHAPDSGWTAVGRQALGGGLVAASVVSVAELLLQPNPARPLFFLFLSLACSALAISRLLLFATGPAFLSHKPRVMVFGKSFRLLRLLAALRRSTHDSLSIESTEGLPFEDMLDRLRQEHIDHVLVEADGLPQGQLEAVLARADQEGISVHITASMFPSTRLVPTWERVAGVPVLGFVSAEMSLGARLAKRSFDVAVSAAALSALALPMLALAVAIRRSSPGRALFVQRRVGLGGRSFPLLKFRTMVADAEDRSGPVFAVENDPRCTRLGRWLRRTNLDELPQLLNVLVGHMSLVGPRPERPEFVEEFKRVLPRYAHKHWVRPGITGWAQVHGLRGARTSLAERIRHDLEYIENWSLVLDIRILVRTVFDGYLNAA